MTTTPANDNTPRPQWFDDLLLQYDRLFMSMCRKRSANDDAAEDLKHDAICIALATWRSYRPGPRSGFVSWMRYKVMTADQQRAKRQRRTPITDDETAREVVTPPNQEYAADLSIAAGNVGDRRFAAALLLGAGYTSREAGKMLSYSNQQVITDAARARDMYRAGIRASNNNNKVARSA